MLTKYKFIILLLCLLFLLYSCIDFFWGFCDGPDYSIVEMDFALVCYNPDGSLNTSFGGDGIVTTDINDYSDDYGMAVLIQPDNKVVVAGYTTPPVYSDVDVMLSKPYDYALVRYNSNGTLDTLFGSNGIVTTDIGNDSYDYLDSAALQPDGKIVVVGYSSQDVALVRYNADGTLDTLFGNNGIVTTDIGNNSYDDGNAIVIQPDGKILVAGESNCDFAVIRYNSDGSLDTSFGSNGIVTTKIGNDTCDVGKAVTLQADGKILVVGWSESDFALVRYNPDGSEDTTFDIDGIVTTDVEYDDGKAIVLKPDGKIIITGKISCDFALIGYNTDGSLDTSFGNNGIVTTDFSDACGLGNAMVLQPDGKIIVAGWATYRFALARYNPDGTPDTTFHDDGKVTTDVGKNNDNTANSVALRSDGRIFVSGMAVTDMR